MRADYIGMFVCARFIGEIPLDLPLVLRQSSPRTPILMLHRQEHDSAEKLVTEFAARKQNRLLRVVLSGGGATEERTARKLIYKAMADVSSHQLVVGFPHHYFHA